MTAEVNNERLAAACSAFFHTRLDDVLHSGYFDSRILDLLPPATVHMLASMPANPQPAHAAAQAAAAHPMHFTDTFNVPPPPPMPVPPPPPPLAPPLAPTIVADDSTDNLASAMAMPNRRPSSPTSSCDDMLAMPDLSPTTSVEAASEFFELFDNAVSFSLDQLPLFPGLPNTPFNALPTAFASLGDALAPPPPASSVRPPPHASSSATSSSSSTASNDNTLRTGQSIAARMPLLQGPVWWQTIDQLRVMLESLRVLVRADMCTLFLADDITDELYARIITNDNRVWEIAMPATLGLVGASFTARQTVNVPSAYNDPRFYRGIDDQLGIRTHALAATPIMTKLNQRPIGVIEVLNSVSQHVFSEANVREIEFVARMAASLVEIAMARVKSTVESHFEAIQSGIGKLQSDEVAGVSQLAGKKRAQQHRDDDGGDNAAAAAAAAAANQQRSSSGRHSKPAMTTSSNSARTPAGAAFSSTMPDLTRRVSMPAGFDPLARRSSEPWTPPKPVPSENPRWLGPTDIFLKTGPLPMFTEQTLFPDGRRKRARPAVPILHLRPLHAHQQTIIQ